MNISGPPGIPAVQLLLGIVEHQETDGVWPAAGNNDAALGGKRLADLQQPEKNGTRRVVSSTMFPAVAIFQSPWSIIVGPNETDLYLGLSIIDAPPLTHGRWQHNTSQVG